MLTAVFLHGPLGEKYGKKLMLDVDSVAGAVALLKANFASFARDVIGRGNAYKVFVGKTNIGQKELLNPAKGQDIHIVPEIVGAGGNTNWVSVIAGVVLIVIGALLYEFGIGAVLMEVGTDLVIAGFVGMIISSFVGSRKISPASSEPRSAKVSRYFNGSVNTVGQGNPVPILYGRLLVGSQVVSAGLSDEAMG